jgi:hypothetical protein
LDWQALPRTAGIRFALLFLLRMNECKIPPVHMHRRSCHDVMAALM